MKEKGIYLLNEYNSPTKIWKKRLVLLTQKKKNILQEMKLFINFYKKNLRHTERANWETVLNSFPLASESRFCWSLLFCKSTNGVGDVITCNHFCEVIKRVGKLLMIK